ncbi:MAG: bifunctional glutamate N-acetyltransferase/amino-acid acetyltransferase ArgJ [Deferribacteres bacterium]|nr:bifunctional glutamate N-acetyltransferase/amino-acid acetyltransferase ArgJ [Deferribacteres bacterium]
MKGFRWVDKGVCFPHGFKAAGIHSGIKADGRKDLALLVADTLCSAAGVFTTNRVKAAPVLVTSKKLAKGRAKAVIVNSGNANACTGERGILDAKEMAALTASSIGASEDEVLVCSTGVIGEPLPMEKVASGISRIGGYLVEDDLSFAEAIMTTDSFPKRKAVEVEADGFSFRIGGCAKGAGMIHPNMATMLAFITTDVEVPQKRLSLFLKEAVDESFNRITVDGDRSTNDTVLMLSKTGVSLPEEHYELFLCALKELCRELALMIVRDGEGATKCVRVVVRGAKTPDDAKRACEKIATSLLFKTALFGEDPNWGRVMGALGASGAYFNPDEVDIYFGDVKLVSGGLFTGKKEEERAKEVMANSSFDVVVDLKAGAYEYYMWTTDLTYDYVRINAEYRS